MSEQRLPYGAWRLARLRFAKPIAMMYCNIYSRARVSTLIKKATTSSPSNNRYIVQPYWENVFLIHVRNCWHIKTKHSRTGTWPERGSQTNSFGRASTNSSNASQCKESAHHHRCKMRCLVSENTRTHSSVFLLCFGRIVCTAYKQLSPPCLPLCSVMD